MTVEELLARISSRELSEWVAYQNFRAAETARQGAKDGQPRRGDTLMHNL